METGDDKSSAVRKLLIPTAASVAGAGAGLILTRKQRTKLRDSLASFDGVGDLAEDLRAKVGSLFEKTPVSSGAGESQPVHKLAPSELEDRRRERAQHRARRAKS